MIGLSLRRIYLIARRDFLGYVRTWGFWIAICSPFLGLLLGLILSFISVNAEPQRYVGIFDETGRYELRLNELRETRRAVQDKLLLQQSMRFLLPDHEQDAFSSLLEEGGAEAARRWLETHYPDMASRIQVPEDDLKLVELPHDASIDELLPYIEGTRTIHIEGQVQTLTGLLHIYEDNQGPQARYWTSNPNAIGLESDINTIFKREIEADFFELTGKSRDDYLNALDKAPKAIRLDPTKSAGEDGQGQQVTLEDRIPFIVAAMMSGFLWLAVFSGVYMLLMGMVEEKINKALEMLLASTRYSEILFGKLLGVAVLTLTSMLPWILVGSAGLYAFLNLGDGGLAGAILAAISPKMIALFILFFALGYIFYGTLFISVGALADSIQDAQTLVTPILLLLTICLMAVPIGVSTPDSPLIRMASFIPFSAPFTLLIRLPSDPPLWEVYLSAGILCVSTLVVLWLSSKLFRYGILSGGGVSGFKSLVWQGLTFWKR